MLVLDQQITTYVGACIDTFCFIMYFSDKWDKQLQAGTFAGKT